MRTFFDSSAYAKRYVEEPGSQAVDTLCAQSVVRAAARGSSFVD
jgi:hypothetical protein